jgi:hypothetical protein
MLRFHTHSSPKATPLQTFHWGDEVSLATGTYQGTVGVFQNLKASDLTWADILERNGKVRSHPVEWLEHTPS